jgi:leucyl/phenylalanyl-tRNA--protein transferase
MTTWLTRPRPVGACTWAFPDRSRWPEDDVIAIGGDLRPATLITAYRGGIFPMVVSGLNVLGWWSPDPRGILPLDNLRVTRSLRQSARHYEVRVDTCFVDVMRGCADPSREDGWITEDFIDAYAMLHDLGLDRAGVATDQRGALAHFRKGDFQKQLFAGGRFTASAMRQRWRSWRWSI